MSSFPSNSLFLSFFHTLSTHSRSALVLDYDGTLAPFHVDRNQAVPYPGVQESLRDILAAGRTHLVLVSGRSPEEVRTLLAIDPAPEIWGVHGQQRLWPDGHIDLAPLSSATQMMLKKAVSWLEQHGYADEVETKHGAIAVHFRGMPRDRAETAQAAIGAAWEEFAQSGRMSILRFDGGIELRPTEPNKGTAVTTLSGELEPGTPLAYLGDDTTDEDAFRALQGTEGLTVLVRAEWRPTEAKGWIRPPQELLAFLHEWAARTGGKFDDAA